MMNSRVLQLKTRHADTTNTIRVITTTSLLVGAVLVLCGCTQQNDGSVFKVQSGDKTLLDIKKNPDKAVSIEVDAPKVDFKFKHDPDVAVDNTTTTTETTFAPTTTTTAVPTSANVVTPVPGSAPQPVPGVPSTN